MNNWWNKWKIDAVEAVVMILFLICLIVISLVSVNVAGTVLSPPCTLDDIRVDERVKTAHIETEKPTAVFKTVTVTSYCACKICCGENAKGITASGKRVKTGMIAASRSIPFGTRIRIEGKIYTVEDRLAKRYDDRIDVYYESHEEAKKFGKKVIQVEIIK